MLPSDHAGDALHRRVRGCVEQAWGARDRVMQRLGDIGNAERGVNRQAADAAHIGGLYIGIIGHTTSFNDRMYAVGVLCRRQLSSMRGHRVCSVQLIMLYSFSLRERK